MEKKTLPQWLNYLESIHPSEIDMGLDRVREIAERMQLIKPAKKVILVAGTNGKGSTVTYCSHILSASGYKVGSYMSPHLYIYNERVKINNEFVSDADLIESFEKIEESRQATLLTYFEFGTLSALYLFKKYNVDCAVIEVGLGGRLDATNIVDPDVSVVTSVGLDHQDWLGSDLSKIAFEKAGVFRSDKPAICGELSVKQSLIDHAQNIGAQLLNKGVHFSLELEAQDNALVWRGVAPDGAQRVFCSIDKPDLPIENLGTALQAVLFVHPSLNIKQINQGIKNSVLPGRMEVFSKPFNGMLDVGHNAQAAALLLKEWGAKPVSGRRIAVFGILADKDAESVVSELKDLVDQWHLVGLAGYRGQTADELSFKLGETISIDGSYDSVENALEFLKVNVRDGDEVLIFGSFITVAKARVWLESNDNG